MPATLKRGNIFFFAKFGSCFITKGFDTPVESGTVLEVLIFMNGIYP